jgi:hypothetical protein
MILIIRDRRIIYKQNTNSYSIVKKNSASEIVIGMSISSINEIPTGIAPFGDPKMGNFFRGDGDGGE